MNRISFFSTLIILIVSQFKPQQSFAQSLSTTQLKFTFIHYLRIPDHYVTVVFKKEKDSVNVHAQSLPMAKAEAKWAATKKDYSFNISKAEYDQVILSIQKISAWAIIGGADFTGYDGTSWQIEFGNSDNAVKYSVWSADYQTEARQLQSFVNACILIIQTAKLDPKEIFKQKGS
ncbi:hypothetical protein QTN47_19550 [Danxiaibacter flavus]|uniref:Uncharacterized protein n=1 Tax=Danxiaibacter flavus TaxID=3049108 RepID=A0ABV3ZJK5_9BACT|nr:hypothetical protein QNM32_19560 [Chitinophagaceae bacterium DXS]